MALNDFGGLLEKRRDALLEYCIGQASRADYPFVQSPADLFELLRMDPLDSFAVKTSAVAEATSAAQQYIHAVYRKLEPGFAQHQFPSEDLELWQIYNNYPDWAAAQLITLYPENYLNPFVRQRKTSLFRTLENDLNQTRLTTDSVQAALRNYLQAFEQICDLDVISAYMDGATPDKAVYYFVGRQRVQPFQYFTRKADIELTPSSLTVNPAAWGEWQAADIQPVGTVLDIRPVLWNGRVCLVWAELVKGADASDPPASSITDKLSVNLAFMTQGGQWSAPLNVYSADAGPADADDFRLIATVYIDHRHPKGKLGILIDDGKQEGSEPAPPEKRLIYDVLMRRDFTDAGGWLDSARLRFATPETVQHALGSHVTVVSEVASPGSMSEFLDLQVAAMRVGTDDVVTVNGLCWPTGMAAGVDPVFVLKLVNPAEGDAEPISKPFSRAGDWATEPLTFRRHAGSWPIPTKFTLKAEMLEYGGKEFSLTIVDLPNFIPPVLLKNTRDAAQFLSFQLPSPYLDCVRTNTLFGPELVQRSAVSTAAVLNWDTQFIEEPPPYGKSIYEPNGAFDGANGLYFWELFFYLAMLVATRLSVEERFAEAQQWLHYEFDPQATADLSGAAPKPDYWRCRPLTNDLGNPGSEALSPLDPDAIGFAAPRHFRIYVFIFYVKNLMAWGDWYYRQLTRDALVAAKLCYVQAGFLMGKAPLARAVTRWETDTLGNLLEKSCTHPQLEQFEQTLDFSLADVGPGSDVPPQLGLLGSEPFRKPINQPLLDLFTAPEERLNTLRNGMTIDGKLMDVPLFSPPTDPNQLLRDLAAGGGGAPRPMGGRLVVNAYRWRVTYEVALRAVQALQDWGGQVLNLLERRDRAQQEELQQTHMMELGDFAQQMQEEAIAQSQASVRALEQSRAVAQQRAEAYAQRYEENVSTVEYEVMTDLKHSKSLSLQAKILKPTGAVIAALPKIFGMSNGGMKPENSIDALCFGLEIASSILQNEADVKSTTESYRRRRDEWGLQRDQALAEVAAIDAQIEAQRHAVDAARINLAQTTRANAQALVLFNFLKKRATNSELFGWMLGQLKALHYQAYDAVVSLCLSAQASMNADTGDYDSQIPLPQVWLDQRHGLTAGEHLRAHLLRMEREHLQRYERRLELVKTVSLRKLFDDPIELQVGVDSWADALKQLQNTGELEFQLTQLLFDRDHPGHYCRQINSVEVDLPVLTGPYENVRATLVQLESKTATRATTQSVQYLHNPVTAAPSDVVINLRSGQQIALSAGIADNGLSAMRPEEGLLNPFEHTGAVSRWLLRFPWWDKEPQVSMLQSITDAIITIRLTAKVGEPTFTQKVVDLVTLAESDAQNNSAKGAGNHE
ncbi:insecticidal toxin complex protein TcaB2 [Pseudomonas sp. NIBR-H-19]|uniref:Tc toxin subunit A-related protein n=1 Tax=Pseudomonas sp. NIBR-H-19 TaxID=2901380 RepID=UPI001E4216B4|nr:neuraminidase-like domain-containing protein [Pseudomonas sp. NIBR-H-19]UHC82927.1 insecticidal toxin complex protein TcaB2 [Pseudomonas sp. NIBR-H-19]